MDPNTIADMINVECIGVGHQSQIKHLFTLCDLKSCPSALFYNADSGSERATFVPKALLSIFTGTSCCCLNLRAQLYTLLVLSFLLGDEVLGEICDRPSSNTDHHATCLLVLGLGGHTSSKSARPGS